MSVSVPATAAKAVATGAVAASVFDLSYWSVAAAIVGAAVSYHFEPEQQPKRLAGLIFGVFASGFAAAFLAAASPQLPGFGWTSAIDITLRAGLLGISIRFLSEQVRRIASARTAAAAGDSKGAP